MNTKNNWIQLLTYSLIAFSSFANAASGVMRNAAISGDNVVTAEQTHKGAIIFNSSTDGGMTWSVPSTLIPSQGLLPTVAVSEDFIAAAFLYPDKGPIYKASLIGGSATADPAGLILLLDSISYAIPQAIAFSEDVQTYLLWLNAQPSIFNPNFFQTTLFSYSPLSTDLSLNSTPDLSTAITPNTITLLAVSAPTAALAIVPQPSLANGIAIVGQFFISEQPQGQGTPWPAGATSYFSLTAGEKNPLLSTAKLGSQQLATSPDLSEASLVWLSSGGALTTSFLEKPSPQWSSPAALQSRPLTSIGGLNSDSTTVLQILAIDNKGHLICATGSGAGGINSATAISQNARQISTSQTEGATGLWLVLDNNNTLSLWQASPQGITATTIATRLHSDPTLSMAVTTDGDTTVLIFDVASKTVELKNATGTQGLGGAGTYVYTSQGGYPLEFTAQKINQ